MNGAAAPAPTYRTVRVAAGRERAGPLTVGQRNMLLCVLSDEPSLINVGEVWDVPAGVTADRVAGAFGWLHARHESLRTTYRVGDGAPTQVVAARGELRIAVHAPGGDPAAFAAGLADQLRAEPFDLATEWPLRLALVTVDGVPVHAVIGVLHLAADAAAIRALRREWLDLLAGRTLPPPTAVQPLDLAEREEASSWRRQESLRYWEAHLRRDPLTMLAVPGLGETDWVVERVRAHSRAAAVALGRAAERTRASRSTVVLAALATLVGRRAGQDAFLAATLSSNRFEPELRDYVGTIAQDALLAVDLAGATTFDQAVRRTHRRALLAYPNSHFDAPDLWATIDRVTRERGARFARDVVFNDLSVLEAAGGGHLAGTPGSSGETAPPEGPPVAAPDVRLTRLPAEPQRVRLMLWALRLEGEVDLVLCAEPQALPAPVAERFAGGLLRLLLEAGDREVDLGELAAITGVEPVTRGPGWLRVDGCWVELAAVERLLNDALGGRPFLLRAVPDERLGHRLVCHLAAGDAPLEPEQAHDACMDRLVRWPTAMAPHTYMVYERAPADRGDPGAWERQPLLACGDGRPSAPPPGVARGALETPRTR